MGEEGTSTALRMQCGNVSMYTCSVRDVWLLTENIHFSQQADT